MRVVTLGPSPYLLTSSGKIHSWIIQHFYSQCNELAILAHSHDTSFFVPEEVEDKTVYCYSFENNGETSKIPIFPYKRGGESPNKTESIFIYELLNKLKPDLLITIDSYENTLFMQAVKMFLPDSFKWLAIILNSSLPINENSRSVIDYADAVLCTNEFSYKHLKGFYNGSIDWNYAGTDMAKFFHIPQKKKDFSIFCSSKNTFKDCPASMMEACKNSLNFIPELKLNLHINANDTGFYNLEILQNRFDLNSEFINFPSSYVSLKDGVSESELNELLNQNHVFLSSSVMSASSISVFEALATGCVPLLSRQGSDEEIMNLLNENFEEKDLFLFETLPFLTMGEKNIYMPMIKSLSQKIKQLYELIENEKKYKDFIKKILKFSKGFDKRFFLNKAGDLARKLVESNIKTFSLGH